MRKLQWSGKWGAWVRPPDAERNPGPSGPSSCGALPQTLREQQMGWAACPWAGVRQPCSETREVRSGCLIALWWFFCGQQSFPHPPNGRVFAGRLSGETQNHPSRSLWERPRLHLVPPRMLLSVSQPLHALRLSCIKKKTQSLETAVRTLCVTHARAAEPGLSIALSL